jgi:hypothetical protein
LYAYQESVYACVPNLFTVESIVPVSWRIFPPLAYAMSSKDVDYLAFFWSIDRYSKYILWGKIQVRSASRWKSILNSYNNDTYHFLFTLHTFSNIFREYLLYFLLFLLFMILLNLFYLLSIVRGSLCLLRPMNYRPIKTPIEFNVQLPQIFLSLFFVFAHAFDEITRIVHAIFKTLFISLVLCIGKLFFTLFLNL